MSKVDHADAIQRYKDGQSQAEIGKVYGVSGQYISRILKKNKVPTRVGAYGTSRMEAKVNHRRILGLYLDGHSIRRIARQTGYTRGAVDYVVRKAGLIGRIKNQEKKK